ncbi:hypothetical protein H7F15_06065 [Pontibacter sp. Tf4]|uniref:hypothetical protein n=1 Tax=Pontibacter sp. Tf4 TaxID=2761620 RepID=UPI00162523F3|nr:hypothetical protein [Pontibacter sp. Tf4]MBB6610594.1 hypothetical protein [Pontibacter sp. Tf4]
MRNYLLLFVSFTLLLFTMPKSNSLRSFTQQAALKKDCKYSRFSGKRTCTKKCLRHHPLSGQQSNAGIASDCSQQVFAIVQEQQSASDKTSTTIRSYRLPHIRKYLSPTIEYDPEPPRLS